MPTPSARRVAAERYRRMARTITDQRTVEALNELATKYEALAAEMEAATGAPAMLDPGQPEAEGRDLPELRKPAPRGLPHAKIRPP
jgi:hypothetical protein